MPNHAGRDWLGMFEKQKEKSVWLEPNEWNKQECLSEYLLRDKSLHAW